MREMRCRTCFLSGAVLFVLLGFPIVGSFGVSSQMWSQTYGGAEDDTAYALVEASDGGFALAGSTWSFGAGKADLWLIKTDEYGNIPEFPSWALLPLLLTATLLAILSKKRVSSSVGSV